MRNFVNTDLVLFGGGQPGFIFEYITSRLFRSSLYPQSINIMSMVPLHNQAVEHINQKKLISLHVLLFQSAAPDKKDLCSVIFAAKLQLGPVDSCTLAVLQSQ